MDASTAKTVRDLIAQGKSRDEIKATLVAKGMVTSTIDDLLDTLLPAAPAPTSPQPLPSLSSARVIQPSPGFDPSKTTPGPPPAPPTPAPVQPPPVAPPPNSPQTPSPVNTVGLSGAEIAFAEQTERGRKKMVRIAIGGGILAVIVVVVGVIVITLQATSVATPLQTVNTACFSVKVPSNYTVTNGNECNIAAVLGDPHNPESQVVIAGSRVSTSLTLADAVSAQQAAHPGAQVITTNIGGNNAAGLKGLSGGSGTPIRQTYVETYEVVTSKIYQPSPSTAPTRVFIVIVGVPPSKPSLADTIVKSISWK
jgi:hypothetical protein